MTMLVRLWRSLWCQHDWRFHRRIYGDERLHIGWAAEDVCTKCGAFREAKDSGA